MEMMVLRSDPLPERLKKWVKHYYAAELVETETTPEDAQRLARVLKWTGRPTDGSTVWLEYMIKRKGKRPRSKPKGDDLFLAWLALYRYEKPGEIEEGDIDTAFARYQAAVRRIRGEND